ncbi:MAG TPA: hypothetical protein VMW38_23945, partial [Terriglobia bacterium]|nr:hypothetical protein [Terriglobia bacterium]
MMKGPFRELIPLTTQHVKVRLPRGKKPRNVQLLVSGKTPHTSEVAGLLTVLVPSILDHEVVAIDF